MLPLADTAGYYPRARLRFVLRFEEYGATAKTPKTPRYPPQNRVSQKDSGPPRYLTVSEQDGRLLLSEPGVDTGTAGGPQRRTQSTDGLTFEIEGVVPNKATFCVNGVRQADTLTATLRYSDLPFDPRCLRSIAVEFYLGCVSAEEQELGVEGQMRPPNASGVSFPFSMIPDDYVDRHGRRRTNLRFQGWVDLDKFVLSQDEATVQIDCTDNTAIFLSEEAPPRLTIAPDKPIDRAIADYLASFPMARGMSVEYRPRVPDDQKPKLASSILPTAQTKKKAGTNAGHAEKVTVWDYLTDVCGMVGHIVRVEGTTVVVQRARTLYAGGFSRPDDPFRGGREIVGQGESLFLGTRMYGYGVNVKELEMSRAYRRRQPANVEVRAYDTRRKKTLIVRFPEKADRTKKLAPGDAADLKFEVVRIAGINDPATLKIIAQNYYESKNRNEVAVRVETKNLGSFGGDNLDPDALDLREGDPVQVEIARRPDASEAMTVEEIDRAEVQRIVDMGFPRALAEAYANAKKNISFPKTFRVRQGTYEWDNMSGVSISLECVNYIEVRLDKDVPDDPTPPGEQAEQWLPPVLVRVTDEVG